MSLAAPLRQSRILLLGLVLAHLAAISHQVDGGGGVSLLQRGALTLLTPLQNGLNALLAGAVESWRAYGFHRQTYEQNRQLELRVRQLETELEVREHGASESERLRELLGLRKALPFETLAAQVVSRDGVPWFRTLTLDKGQSDGVVLNAPVLSPTGVVGRVFAVGPHAARVQVLLDRDSGAGVVVERSRAAGVVSGQVTGPDSASEDLVMKYVEDRADVVVGDVVVTSGLDRIYPKGLVVGRVRSVKKGAGLFQEIRVEPSARFSRLEEVLVVRRPALSLDTPVSVQ
jgi:rod shape-determining protein MreC